MPENYAVDFESNIDLHDNQIKNVLIDNVATDPAGTPGQIIYNTTEHVLKYFDQGSWVVLAQGGNLGNYQLLSQKNQANGYAGLDANSKIVIAQLPTGTTAQTIPLIVGTIGDGAVLQYSQSSGGFVARTLGTVYQYKGSVTNSTELPDDASAGDVYNIESAGGGYNAGDNVAWTGSAWDKLAGTIDTTGFQTTANLVQDFSSPSATTYPSTQAVANALGAKEDAIDLTPGMAVISAEDGGLEASAVTSTELGFLSGVTSAIQTQINSKQNTITGAATTITTANLTENRVLVSNASGKVDESSVTSTELGFLSGVTSSVQTQLTALTTALNGKVDALESGPSAGTYTKVTVNTDGLVTTGANLAATDIPDLSETYILMTQKGAASGVATLGADSKVPIAQIPTGNGANLVPVPAAAGTAGQVLAVNSGANGFVFTTPLKRVSQPITGDGSTTSFPVTHGLNGVPVSVVIVNDTTKAVVNTNVAYTNSTQITVNFNTAPAVGTNYTVYMSG